jgi:hypothetical protein
MARDQIIDFPLVRREGTWISRFDRVDGRVSLIVLVAYLWFHEFTVNKFSYIFFIGGAIF